MHTKNSKLCRIKTKYSCKNVELQHFGKITAFDENFRDSTVLIDGRQFFGASRQTGGAKRKTGGTISPLVST